MKQASDLYQSVTDAIIEALENGCPPWQKSWSGSSAGFLPMNLKTGARYNGINILIFWMKAELRGYASPSVRARRPTQLPVKLKRSRCRADSPRSTSTRWTASSDPTTTPKLTRMSQAMTLLRHSWRLPVPTSSMLTVRRASSLHEISCDARPG